MSIRNFFHEPPATTELWRYMSFDKYMALLDSNALFFPTGALLREIADSYEGSLSSANVEATEDELNNLLAFLPAPTRKVVQNSVQLGSHLGAQASGDVVLVSCWHMSDYESVAMWNLYVRSGTGLAVRTTVDRLNAALQPPGKVNLLTGKVNYIDYQNESMPEDADIRTTYAFKRKSFEHERELRVLGTVPLSEGHDKAKSSLAQELQRNMGLNITIDLATLIDAVYISPTAPTWFYELVKSITAKYGLDKPVLQSDLSKDPVY